MEALIFDCDGVLAETEKNGHRVTVNMAFTIKKINVEWSVGEYKRLLTIAGGKERMTYYFNEVGWPEQYPEREQLIVDLHKLKTEYFMQLIHSGNMPLRSGIVRIVDEALANNIKLAACSTANVKSVSLIVALLGKERAGRFNVVIAGDMLSRKKPDPEIYNLCAKKLNINPSKSVVVEDNRNGLLTAKAAGFNCLITTSEYTVNENFSEANMLVDELGDDQNIKVSINDLIILCSRK